ncbi:hypothetical protein BD410DRAFT_522344 [Rickenella mellea]|uniref:BTB domain-containing protein n=1 Tax=Rickenella mellea TaxID=50990 RepID=A0A4Y7QFS5_9AGAM|nr:hypothetical protein BD410DRAFT_522344 [Rickenella mellea]
MTSLHAYYLLRNQQAFQRLLESSIRAHSSSGSSSAYSNNNTSSGSAKEGTLSTSGGRSWSRPSPLSTGSTGGGGGGGGGVCDVNAKDWLGRTVLHLAVSSTDAASLSYVRLLLLHPRIDINILDAESHWSALHRALYVGNLPACLLLLQRPEIDTSLKDLEGYTAYDLYNSTVEGTKPKPCDGGVGELFTWGTNRNATLGTGDSSDRTYPDQIAIFSSEVKRGGFVRRDVPGDTRRNAGSRKEGGARKVDLGVEKRGEDEADDEEEEETRKLLTVRFLPVGVRCVGMGRLHTVVVTTESRGNLRLCGFGGGGRLGPGNQHTQYALVPLSSQHNATLSGNIKHGVTVNANVRQFNENVTITRVALGQDHTLALSAAGDVWSWGLGRFGQLGYAVEPPSADGSSSSTLHPFTSSSSTNSNAATTTTTSIGTIAAGAAGLIAEDPIQSTPKRIYGALRKSVVVGIACCKTASACWTDEGELFTWGLNSGQLGYERVGSGSGSSSSSVQITPRKVTHVTDGILGVAISDSTMAVLLETKDVICFWNDRHFKINFPANTFPVGIHAYHHAPQSTSITKVVNCEDMFAALSTNGELFTFQPPSPAVTAASAAAHVSTSAPTSETKEKMMIRPQRVWALRKQFSAVKDVAISSDGSIILCTESGHVYIRSRSSFSTSASSTAKSYKFHRVPYLQRVVAVNVNSTGAYAALRVDAVPKLIRVLGNTPAEDLGMVQPYLRYRRLVDGGLGLGCAAESSEGSEMAVPTSFVNNKNTATETPTETSPSTPTATVTATPPSPDNDPDEDTEDTAIQRDIKSVIQLCDLLLQDKHSKKTREGRGIFDGDRGSFGADLLVRVVPNDAKGKGKGSGNDGGNGGGGIELPVHRTILAARCSTLGGVLLGQSAKDANITMTFSDPHHHPHPRPHSLHTSLHQLPVLTVSGCHPLSVLLLLMFLYSDELLAVWDRRLGLAVEPHLKSLNINPAQIKRELQALGKLLSLPHLSKAVGSAVKYVPTPSVAEDLQALFDSAQQNHDLRSSVTSLSSYPLILAAPPDTILELSDRRVCCHSPILRSRSPFFASFFDDEDWTIKRWNNHHTITVNLKHLDWRVMSFVLRYVYGGQGEDMFETLDFVHSMDDVLDFLFKVMAAASELLLDRLSLICSAVILRFVNINNVCSILVEATYYHATQLVQSLQPYMACNMETLLESRMLDDLPHDVIKNFSASLRILQAQKSPIARSDRIINKAMDTYADWLAQQDIPQPVVRAASNRGPIHSSPKLSPVSPGRMSRRQSLGMTAMSLPPSASSPLITPQPLARTSSSNSIAHNTDDLFTMDEHEAIPSLNLEPTLKPQSTFDLPEVPPPQTPPSSGPWKRKPADVPRVDMKAIMAEAEGIKIPQASAIERIVGFSVPDSGTSVKVVGKTSQRERRKMLASSSTDLPEPPLMKRQSSSKADSPWRLPVTPNPSLPLVTSPLSPEAKTPAEPSTGGSNRTTKDGVGSLAPNSRRPAASKPSTPPAKVRSEMGPTFNPSRQSPTARGSMTPRRVVWTAPPVLSLPDPPPPPSSPLSFLTIQKQQLDQGLNPVNVKKSLKEIQEEEQARQAEEEFMRWWAAEEQRVQQESQVSVHASQTDEKTSKKPPRRKKNASSRGVPSNVTSNQGNLRKSSTNSKGRPST